MYRFASMLASIVLVSATAPATTMVTPFEWSADHSWKERVFTATQPFLDPEATEKWLARKEHYRQLRATGQL